MDHQSVLSQNRIFVGSLSGRVLDWWLWCLLSPMCHQGVPVALQSHEVEGQSMRIPGNEPWQQEMPHTVAIETGLGFFSLFQHSLDLPRSDGELE